MAQAERVMTALAIVMVATLILACEVKWFMR